MRLFPSSLSVLRGRWLALALALLVAPALAAQAQQCPSLVWADEFDGSALDLGRWSHQIGDGCAEGICGWGNNELQYYQAENVSVESGLLKITAKKQRVRGKAYTSGRIRTLDKGDWTYGRFEARIKMVQGQGMWPAFWMLPTDEVYGGWPQSGEIDIMENVGFEPSTVHGTIHYGDPYPDNRSSGEAYSLLSGIFADGFHTFAIEKEPGLIRWMVDDVLFAERTPADLSPYPWPFDERFHFILNVAVGGNWPGSPDSSTVFPQTLEVDYVRVYDGNQPHLSGERRVPHQASGVTYSVGEAPGGASFSWSVPAGASIVSGQGSDTITVDWGTSGGTVSVDVSSGCGSRQLAVEVEVEPPYELDFTFENFDDPEQITLDAGTSGSLTEVSNPDPSGVNASALSGRYVRDAGSQYDVLVYGVSAITDAAEYSTRQKKFSVDVYTSAPVGSTVLLQLENSATATPNNYPSGRHSRYQAQTTVQNQWERIELPYLDAPDPSTPDGSVDTLIFLFAPNTFTGDVYHWDNFDSYRVAGTGGGDPTSLSVAAVSVGTQGAGQGKKRGAATVSVVDDLGAPVAGATVSGTFSGDFAESAAGDTGGDGEVTLTTNGTKKGSLTLTFCVDDVSHPTLPYDPSANAATCGSL